MNQLDKNRIAACHRLFVEALQKDGAICNYNERTYDAEATAAGGNSYRSIFSLYNKQVIDYHRLLKVLGGDQRANISEAVPVIDYVHPENSDLMNTYVTTTDLFGRHFIDPTSIKAIPESSWIKVSCVKGDTISPDRKQRKTALQFLLEDDPYIINRAISGRSDLSEHFYNTSSSSITTTNIQTDSWAGGSEKELYIYKGVLSKQLTGPEGETFRSIRPQSIMYYQYTESPVGDTLEDNQEGEADPDAYALDKRFILYNREDVSADVIELNPTLYKEPEPTDMIGDTYPFHFSTEDTVKAVSVELLEGDSCVLIPSVNYSIEPSILIIIKKNELSSKERAKDKLAVPIPAYKIFVTPVSYMHTSNNVQFSPLETSSQFPLSVISDHNVFAALSKLLKLERIRLLNASGLMSGAFCEPYTYSMGVDKGRDITSWRVMDDTELAAARGISIPVGSRYFPGHILNRGNFLREPLKLTKSDYLPADTVYLKTGQDTYRALIGEEKSEDFDGNVYVKLDNGLYIAVDNRVYTFKAEAPDVAILNYSIPCSQFKNTYRLPRGIMGKAELLYSKFNNQIEKLFDKVQTTNWQENITAHTILRLDSVVTGTDFGGSGEDTAAVTQLRKLLGREHIEMLFPDKFKLSEANGNKPVSYVEIKKYFDYCVNSLSDDGKTLTLRLSDPINSYKVTNSRNPTWFFGDWFAKSFNADEKLDDLKIKWSKIYNIGFIRDLTKHYHFCLKGYHRLNTSRLDQFSGLRVSVLSPMRAFTRSDINNGQQTTILIYPTSVEQFPQELYLISNKDLGLNVYGEQQKDSNGNLLPSNGGSVSFYCTGNEGTEDDDKLLMFKVLNKLEFCPSKITQIRIIDDSAPDSFNDTDEFQDGTRIKSCSAEDRISRLTATIKRNPKPADYDPDDPEETRSPNSFWDPLYSYGKRYISNGNDLSADDCYIYTLGPMELSMETFKFFDQNDVAMNLQTGVGDIQIMPLAYPVNYFSTKPRVNAQGETCLEVDMESIGTDISSLEDSLIIPDMPAVDDIKQFKNIKIGSTPYTMNIYGKLIDDGVGALARTLIKKALKQILSNWKISDSPTSPMLLKDIVYTARGLSELKPLIGNLDKSNFEAHKIVPETDKEGNPKKNDDGSYIYKRDITKILSSDLEGLLRRITKETSLNTYTFDVDIKQYGLPKVRLEFYSGTEPIEPGSPACFPKDLLKNIYVTLPGSSEEIPAITYTASGVEVNQYLKDHMSLPDLVYYALSTVTTVNQQTNYEDGNRLITVREEASGDDNIKPSIESLKNAVASALGEKGNLTQDSCRILDRSFGNGAPALLEFGERYAEAPGVPASLTRLNEKVVEQLELAIFEADKVRKQYIEGIKEIQNSQKYKEATIRAVETYNKNNETWFTLYNDYINEGNNIVQSYYVGVEAPLDEDGFFQNSALEYEGHNNTFSHPSTYQLNTSSSAMINIIQKISSNGTIPSPYSFWEKIGRFFRGERLYLSTEEAIKKYLLNEPNNSSLVTTQLSERERADRNKILLEITTRADRKIQKALSSLYIVSCQLQLRLTKPSLGPYIQAELEKEGIPDPEDITAPPIDPEEISKYVETLNRGSMSYQIPNIESGESPYMRYLNDFKLPTYSESTETKGLVPVDSSGSSGLKKSHISFDEISRPDWWVDIEAPDVSENILSEMLKFAQNNLTGSTESSQLLTSVGDTDLIGNPDSLYYKRYEALNNRLNTQDGTLYRASQTDLMKQSLKNRQKFMSRRARSLEGIMETIPIVKMSPLAYLKEDKDFIGKYYYKESMDALRYAISDKCVLTCTRCSVKATCPFYDEETLLKKYCPPANSIDLWVKDNELDLLYYDNEDEVILKCTSGEHRNGIKASTLRAIHAEYANILSNNLSSGEEVTYAGRSLEAVIQRLVKGSVGAEGVSPLNSKNVVDYDYTRAREGMGWLLGGRYGTIEKNTIGPLLANTHPELNFPKYKYLYNAVFLEDTESYVSYTPSTKPYPVEVHTGPFASESIYEGKVKIKIPYSLKIFEKANLKDEVYLVSDDTTGPEGESIEPVIYLGHVGDLKYTFDLIDDQNSKGAQTESSRLYAKDVAQACANYIKGDLFERPLGTGSDAHMDYDQYWMKELYKRVTVDVKDDTTGSVKSVDKWIKLPGRPRAAANRTEVILDPSNIDDALILAGRPSIVSYENFIRKISILIYEEDSTDSLKGKWVIPFANERFFAANSLEYEVEKEKKRRILPLMRTNLRLVVLKTAGAV